MTAQKITNILKFFLGIYIVSAQNNVQMAVTKIPSVMPHPANKGLFFPLNRKARSRQLLAVGLAAPLYQSPLYLAIPLALPSHFQNGYYSSPYFHSWETSFICSFYKESIKLPVRLTSHSP